MSAEDGPNHGQVVGTHEIKIGVDVSNDHVVPKRAGSAMLSKQFSQELTSVDLRGGTFHFPSAYRVVREEV